MSDKARCSQQVFDNGRACQGWQCFRVGVVQRRGKAFCRQHDPEAVAARRTKREAKWKAQDEAGDAILAEAQRLARALGCEGSAYYSSIGSQSQSGYRRSLVISFEAAEILARRLAGKV